MSKGKDLKTLIDTKNSFLCIGLDTAPDKIPVHLRGSEDPVFEFNKAIIEATADLAVAYKPNIAFYEALGPLGWDTLQKTMEVIPDDVFTIADAKRGDIGNTSRMYAQAFFEQFDFDSITVAPYMGRDSVAPFLEFEGKTVFLLALTSNPGAQDFQWHGEEGSPLYEEVLRKGVEWGNELPGDIGFVAGATRPEYLRQIREIAPDNCLLVPGVGAQGGSVEDVLSNGKNAWGGLLINSSRGILYAGDGEDFASKARDAALELVKKMNPGAVESPGS